jgi:phosphopentomutase
LIAEGRLSGILGNCQASGIEIIERLGAKQIKSGAPICYTSADSVLQIAAHETIFGRERLYDLCRTARRLCDPLNIGRV